MKKLKDLLQDADPLGREADLLADEYDFRRQAVLLAASRNVMPAATALRSRIAVLAVIASMAVASLLGIRIWLPLIGELQAAVRFEVRLAEDSPAPGLHEAKVSNSNRLIYLYDEAVVTNSDIASARVIQGNSPSQYGVAVEFTASGTEKMREARGNHVGKPVAILLDGKVVVAPVVRSPIGDAATINGDYTKAQAEKIVNGIGKQ